MKNIAFYDDALLMRADAHIMPILEGISRKGISVNFHTPNGLHAKLIDKGIAKKLKELHFKTIRLSLETVDEKRQEATGGKVTTRELEKAVENFKKAGYKEKEIGVYLMLGMPHQREEEVKEGIKFLHSLKVMVILASYSLVPGTPDEKRLKETGIIKNNLDPLWHNNTIFPLIEGNFSLESIKSLREYASSLNREQPCSFI